jgi:hypothetical protein
MPDYTPHQHRIIKGYYDRREEIMLAKLGEIVSELYLVDSDAKRDRLWDRAAKAMNVLKIQPATVLHILGQRKPEVLAHNLRVWLDAGGKGSQQG